MRWIGALTTGALAMAVSLAASPAEAQYGAPPGGEWRSYAGDSGSTKYSPLDQITADNFADLEVRWHWTSVDSHLVRSTRGGDSLVAADTLFDILQADEPDLWTAWDGVRQTRARPTIRSLVATPLMVDGVLYLSTPLYRAAAIDARSGETLWVHDPRAYESGMPPIGDTRGRHNVRFYIVAMLFLIFDVELAFLYPWVVLYSNLDEQLFLFIEALVFIGILGVGYVYAWRKGALDWKN